MSDPRTRFASTAVDLVDRHADTALVYAEIGGQFFGAATARHPERVVNVGIREQLLVNVGAGMSLADMFPIVHTFAPFLVERAYEQIKLGFGHQDVDGLLVSTGGSVDMSTTGRTHQTDADVALIDAVPGFEIHVPGTADEVETLMRAAHRRRGRHYVRVTAQQNSTTFDVAEGRMHIARHGSSHLVVLAVGPTLDAALRGDRDRPHGRCGGDGLLHRDRPTARHRRIACGSGAQHLRPIPRRGGGRAVPGRDIGASCDDCSGRPAAPAAVAGSRARRASPLRVARAAPACLRPRRRRSRTIHQDPAPRARGVA
ncbi:hypothetical protein [Williamsia sp. M5A3_1d]